MKILVTGIAGFIGFHLSKKLMELGHQVVGLDCINDYYDVGLKLGRLAELGLSGENKFESKKFPGLIFRKIELENQSGINALFEEEKFDFVYHLAAQAGVRYSLEQPLAYIHSNVVGFTHILECCKIYGIRQLVFASSSSVYGLNKKIPFSTSDQVDQPISVYAATKKSNELLAHTYAHLFGLPVIGLRFFTVYGPWGRPDMAYMLFANAITNNMPIKIFNHGRMKRDFTYIDDIIGGMISLLKGFSFQDKIAPYKIYNIGNNTPVALLEFVEILEELLGKKALKEFLPIQPGDVEETYADISDLCQDFGFKPNTSLREGLSQFVNWYKNYYDC
jgi:UDP-glucuronate 4-epimerase